jgi:hypothetical protein
VDNSDVHSDTSMSLTAGVDGGKLGNAKGGGSTNNTSNLAKKSTNVTRHLSGHIKEKLSTGPINIDTGAQDMINF